MEFSFKLLVLLCLTLSGLLVASSSADPISTSMVASSKNPFIGGHGPVCGPNCGLYGATGDEKAFAANRCCTFMPCWSEAAYDKEAYAEFRKQYCQSTTTTSTTTTTAPCTSSTTPAPCTSPSTPRTCAPHYY